MTPPRAVLLSGIVAVLIGGCYWVARGDASPAAPPVAPNGGVVVAELFTSEGCSSCPPADQLLSRLVQRQPVPGVIVLGLSENVDYWNDLGWVDPFSSNVFTKRQTEYDARVFRGSEVYTPQLVIDGSLQEVGSDSDAVYRAIGQAAGVPKAAVKVAADLPLGATTLQIQVKVDAPPKVNVGETSDAVVAVTEDNLASDVLRGENGGHRLQHSGIVRTFFTLGTLAPQARTWSGTTSIAVSPDWNLARVKVIGFLQEHRSRRIIGAGWSEVHNQPVAAVK